MQLLIAILALPATALLALGSTNKERFWGNLLALLAAPLWLAQEVRHGQWLLMAATGGAIAPALQITEDRSFAICNGPL